MPPPIDESDRLVAPADKPVTSPSTVGSVLTIRPRSDQPAASDGERRSLRAGVIATIAAAAFVAAAAVTYGLRVVRPASSPAGANAAAAPAGPTEAPGEGQRADPAPSEPSPATPGSAAPTVPPSAVPSADTGVTAPAADTSAAPVPSGAASAGAKASEPGEASKKSKGGKAAAGSTASPKSTGPYRPKVL